VSGQGVSRDGRKKVGKESTTKRTGKVGTAGNEQDKKGEAA